jgi:hypothetical protein
MVGGQHASDGCIKRRLMIHGRLVFTQSLRASHHHCFRLQSQWPEREGSHRAIIGPDGADKPRIYRHKVGIREDATQQRPSP